MTSADESRQAPLCWIPTPLEATGHTFKIRLDQFGELGQDIFREIFASLDRPWMQVTAINAPGLDHKQVFSILQQPDWLPQPWEVRVAAPPQDGMNKFDVVHGASSSHPLTLFYESDRTKIPWESLRISHVIQSSEMSVLRAQSHLLNEGARRVLVAGSSDALQFDPHAARSRMRDHICTPVLTFRPGILASIAFRALYCFNKLRQHRVERVVGLCEDILSRDAVGACYLWSMAGDGRNGPESWEEEFESALEWFLGPYVVGAETREHLEGALSGRPVSSRTN